MNNAEVIDFSITTPGKVILHGEHSVVYGKTALAASVNLKTILKFSNRVEKSEPTAILDFPCLEYTCEIPIKDLWDLFKIDKIPLLRDKPLRTFCLNNPEAIDFEKLCAKAKYFIEIYDLKVTGNQENAMLSFLCIFWGMFKSIDMMLPSFHIRVTSELDIGAGMGSSTAYNICIAAAFLQFIRRTKLQQLGETCEISKTNYKSFKYWSTDLTTFEKGELDLISRWGHLGDKVMHGNPSGIDNAVCTYGSVIEFKKGAHGPDLKIIPDPKFLKILLVNSKVSRNTRKLVSSVAIRRDRFASVVEPILQAMDSVALSAAEVLRHMSQLSSNLDPPNSNALEKTLSEEIGKLEELIDINQKLLEALGVSHDTLEHICRIAKLEGLHGKLTGAGGGGYAYVMLPFQDYEKQLCAVRMSFERHHFPVQQVSLGGPGVTLAEHFWRCPSLVMRESLEPSLDFTEPPVQFNPSAAISSSTRVIPTEPIVPDTNEDEMDEWPWPFNLRELVKSMFQNQIQDDLQYDELSVPLRNLCAVNVPGPLPQWMYKLTDFQDQISPVWNSILQESRGHQWRHEEDMKDITKRIVNDATKIAQFSNYDDVVEDSIKSMKQEKQAFAGPISVFDPNNKLRLPRDERKKMGECVPTPDSKQGDDNVNEDCYIPKQICRDKLFGQLDRPAKWLKDQFPPYGGRQWTSGSKIEETAKQQLENLHTKHKKFLKGLKAGCEYMTKDKEA